MAITTIRSGKNIARKDDIESLKALISIMVSRGAMDILQRTLFNEPIRLKAQRIEHTLASHLHHAISHSLWQIIQVEFKQYNIHLDIPKRIKSAKHKVNYTVLNQDHNHFIGRARQGK